jgi:hypothetical protein
MNYFEKYLKYKRKYLDLKGGDNNCGVDIRYGTPELINIANKWNQTREVSWSSGQEGYYLMHKPIPKPLPNPPPVPVPRNNCTDMSNHIHIINAYTDIRTDILMLQFSQKILDRHINIPDAMIDHVTTLRTIDEIDIYLRSINLTNLITNSYNNNKVFSLSGGYRGYNETIINTYLYHHSLIGERIRIINTPSA